MRLATYIRPLMGLSLFGLGVATGLMAQAYGGLASQDNRQASNESSQYGSLHYDSGQRIEQKRTDLSGQGINTSDMEVIASIAEYSPGMSIGLHTHHGIEVAYVLQGASIQIPGKEPITLATDTTAMNLRDIKHAGFKVVGDTPLKLFTVHIVDKGKPLYDYANN